MFFRGMEANSTPACLDLLTQAKATPASRNSSKRQRKTEYSLALRNASDERKSTPSASFRHRAVNGSLTIEAALVMPVFLLVILAVYAFFNIMTAELRIQEALEKTAGRLAAGYYAVDKLSDSEEDRETLLEKAGKEVFYAAVSETLVRALVVRELGDSVGPEVVKNGTGGISFLGSRYDSEKCEVQLRAHYQMTVPFFGGSIGNIQVSQQCARRAWIGKETPEPEEEVLVYITDTGKVYHTFLSCGYLKLSISSVDLSDVPGLRNRDGSKYYPCETCGDGSGDKVFITGYGDRYHYNRNCSGLKRGIKSVPLSEVGDRSKCKKCEKKEGS